MHLRKITKEGRVNIPVEYLDRFQIKENDFVEVTCTRSNILIKKHRDSEICCITGKVSKHLTKVGESYISKEGFKILREKMGEKDL